MFLFDAAEVSFYCGDRGAVEYNRNGGESLDFVEKEASIFKTIRNNDEYSNTGVEFFLSPGVESIFFNAPKIMYQLTTQINTIAKLTLNDGFERFRISGRPRFRFRFSTTVRMLFLAFTPIGEREYLKFLIGLYSGPLVYNSLFPSLLLVAVLGLFFMIAGAILGAMFRGISTANIDYFHFFVFIAASGASIIHLTTERIVELESKRRPTVDFDEHNQWSALVGRLKRLSRKRKRSASLDIGGITYFITFNRQPWNAVCFGVFFQICEFLLICETGQY